MVEKRWFLMTDSLLTVVRFSRIFQWDVKQFFSQQIVSNYPIDKLGNHLTHQTEKVQLSDYPNSEFVLLGISNKIGMFDATIEKGKKIKQKYHIVKENWIAYNPYRINVGSIGIKTGELSGEYISPAYVVFSCKDTLLPEYFLLMLKSEYFKKLIQDSTTGSVRQILSYEKLANLEAPIPSIEDQKKLLQEYHNTMKEAEKNKETGKDCEAGLLHEIQSIVSSLKSKTESQNALPSILQTINFSSTNRWDVTYNLKEGILAMIYKTYKYPCLCISQLQKESLYGLSLKASSEKKEGMIPMLRMSNIVNGDIDCTDMKFLPYKNIGSEKDCQKWLLRKGDLLINRTNSKELVGKAAVFNLDGKYTYASYVIRYRLDTRIVLPEYVNIMFMLPIVRKQIDTISRQTAGQCNINSDEIGSIQIPVPPLTKQQEIITYYNSTRNNANNFYKQSKKIKEKALENFENAVFSKNAIQNKR